MSLLLPPCCPSSCSKTKLGTRRTFLSLAAMFFVGGGAWDGEYSLGVFGVGLGASLEACFNGDGDKDDWLGARARAAGEKKRRGLDALFFLWRRCLLPEVERGTASIVSAYLGSGLEKASRLVNGDGDEGESEGYGSLREEATVAGEFIGDW
ncbi:hypothetical protein V6N11_032601 [Hibiscus sabdariffa]|uniref:Uncharacterized protein n=1 Tax=Hibiscus sabdariffa TaxID=183260 RepID=A0ABR2T1B7_9ROSI